MNIEPTKSRRNVVLALQIKKRTASQTERRSSETRSITRICVLFDDHDQITEEIFRDTDEATMLSRFWNAIRANDRIFGADIANRLELVRRRSWNLRVIPSAEIHLRQVYCHELLDTERLWTRAPKDLTCAEGAGGLRY